MLSEIPMPTHIPSISFANDVPSSSAPATMLSGLNDKAPDAPAPATLPSDHVHNVMNSHPPTEPPPCWWQDQIVSSIPLP
jgi:hypothetical protein